jgi:transcriptional regulator with XRE-family HTH domain
VKITNQMADDALLMDLGGRLARMRVERNLTQAQLAERAGISKRTVERLEKGAVATQLAGFIRVCRILGILDRFEALLPEPVHSPVMQLKLRGKQRRRAYTSKKKEAKGAAKKWQWGDGV